VGPFHRQFFPSRRARFVHTHKACETLSRLAVVTWRAERNCLDCHGARVEKRPGAARIAQHRGPAWPWLFFNAIVRHFCHQEAYRRMDSALIDQTSQQFLGQWKRLVSTTNWEKGQIIHEWREALRASDAPASEYADDAWARRVGNVTPQHVGRLRRAHERFGAVRDDYTGLFWSHFQAALDWDDAEMWLEGASQNGWSISEMRQQRWEARGEVADSADAEDVAPPWDEDAEPNDEAAEVTSGSMATAHSHESAADDSQDYGDDDAEGYDRTQFDDDGSDATERAHDGEADEAPRERVRPFASLPPLPADVNDAFEAFKLCILRHKIADWQEISQEDLLASLEALKQLALTPVEV